jgi:diguanylate cyclase (GGDEF)-like protein
MTRAPIILFLLALLAAPAPGRGQTRPGSAADEGGAQRAAALTERGEAEQQREENRAAQATFGEALALLAREGLRPPARLLKGAGLSELILGDYNKALDFLLRAEAEAEKSNDREIAGASQYLIGYVHRDLGNYDLALEHFRKAYESGRALGHRRREIMSLNEIGNVFVYREQFAAALPYKERSLQLARQHGDADLLANGLHDLGNLYLSQERAADALPLLQEALAIDRRLQQTRGIAIALLSLADCQRRLGRPAAALAALDEARPLAEKAGLRKDLSVILSLYSVVHEQTGDFRRALAYQRRYQSLWQELFNEEKTRQTAEMQARYEVEKKRRENELLKRERQIADLAMGRQRSQRNFLFFAGLLVLLLAGAFLLGFRSKARANRWLEEANSRIAAQQGKLEKAYYQMEELARRDPLTGLPNRRAALEAIAREEARCQRSQKAFTLVMADLDGFKAVNDALGHDAGDTVLREAAALFSGSLRAQDTVARWGGDEFLFLLPETDADGARVLCAAIRERIAGHSFRCAGRELRLRLSMGAATCHSGLSTEDCLREADQAMYRSRNSGRPDAPRG